MGGLPGYGCTYVDRTPSEKEEKEKNIRGNARIFFKTASIAK
jgi:hypothetical protein